MDASTKTLSIGTRNYTIANNNTYFISGTITGATAGTMYLGGGIATSVPVNSITMYTGTHASSGGTSAITITSGQELDINTTAGIKFYDTYSGGTGLSFGTALSGYEEYTSTVTMVGPTITSGTSTWTYYAVRIGKLITVTMANKTFTYSNSCSMTTTAIHASFRPTEQILGCLFGVTWPGNTTAGRSALTTSGTIDVGTTPSSNSWGPTTVTFFSMSFVFYKY